LVTISDHTERIEESKRSLGTKSILEGVQGGGSGGMLGGGESGGRGEKGGEDNSLHLVYYLFDDRIEYCERRREWNAKKLKDT
jgi:hypothetical protein